MKKGTKIKSKCLISFIFNYFNTFFNDINFLIKTIQLKIKTNWRTRVRFGRKCFSKKCFSTMHASFVARTASKPDKISTLWDSISSNIVVVGIK